MEDKRHILFTTVTDNDTYIKKRLMKQLPVGTRSDCILFLVLFQPSGSIFHIRVVDGTREKAHLFEVYVNLYKNIKASSSFEIDINGNH